MYFVNILDPFRNSHVQEFPTRRELLETTFHFQNYRGLLIAFCNLALSHLYLVLVSPLQNMPPLTPIGNEIIGIRNVQNLKLPSLK